jgi:hypothetical protein
VVKLEADYVNFFHTERLVFFFTQDNDESEDNIASQFKKLLPALKELITKDYQEIQILR